MTHFRTLARSRRWALAVLTLGAVGAPVLASAADSPAQNASLEVTVIEGSKGDTPRLDPKLEPLRKELEKLAPFRVFRLLNTSVLSLTPGQKQPVKLPDGSQADVQVTEIVSGPPYKVRYALTLPGSRQSRVAARGARFVDVLPAGEKVWVVSIAVQ